MHPLATIRRMPQRVETVTITAPAAGWGREMLYFRGKSSPKNAAEHECSNLLPVLLRAHTFIWRRDKRTRFWSDLFGSPSGVNESPRTFKPTTLIYLRCRKSTVYPCYNRVSTFWPQLFSERQGSLTRYRCNAILGWPYYSSFAKAM